MKAGQLYVVHTNNATAEIEAVKGKMVWLKWLTKPDGMPCTRGKKAISYTKDELQAGVNSGDVSIVDKKSKDPNMQFLMKKMRKKK